MGKRKKGVAVALDLGNTTTLVATINKDGHVQIVPDPDGLERTPTAIGFEGGDPDAPLYGRSASSYRKVAPEYVCVFGKRARGRMDSPGIVDIQGRTWSVQELESLLAVWRLKHASEFLGEPVVGVLASVPAAFNDAQRRATADIVEQAGYACVGIVNEPTAALLGYARERPGVFAVSDLGGGTYDTTVLRVEEGAVYTVIATSGQDDLGGREFTAALVNRCVEHAQTQGAPLDPAENFREMVMIEQACENAKIELTAQKSALITFRTGDRLHDLEVTREEFEALVAPLTERILHHMKSALEQAELTPEGIDGAVFAGGGSRVPCARRPIEDLFGEGKILRDIHLDNAVVTGACYAIGLKLKERRQAGDTKLVGSLPGYFLAGQVSLQEIVGQALGVEAFNTASQRLVLAPILEKGVPLPASATKTFGLLNGDKGQVDAAIKVLQGEAYSPAPGACFLGAFPLCGLPAGPSEDRIEVTFEMDTNGRVELHAVDKNSGMEIKQEVDAVGAVAKADV